LPSVPEVLDDPVDERVIDRELRHASLLLESLWRGDNRMPRKLSVGLTVCAVPSCPELTYGALCLVHELERRAD
jgi:hypothetical protein